MNWMIGMNGLSVVSIIIGGAVLSLSVLSAIGAGLGMVLNSQLRREQEAADDADLAEAIAKQVMRQHPEPMPHPRPMSHRPMRELDFATMTSADIARAFDLEPGVPAPKPATLQRLGTSEAHPANAG